MARIVCQTSDSLAQAVIAGPAESHAAGLAGLVGHGYRAGLCGEPIERGEALAHVTELGQDLRGTHTAGAREGHDDLPVRQRRDEALDAPREVCYLRDQGVEHGHQRAHHVRHRLVGELARQGLGGGAQTRQQFGRAATAAVVLGAAKAQQLGLAQVSSGRGRGVAAQERQADGRGDVGEDAGSAGPEGLERAVQLIAQRNAGGHQIIARAHQGAQRADRIGLRRQCRPAVPIGAQQVGQQVGVASVALGAVAAVARAAGLDRVGVDREDLVAGLDQGIDDQARRALDGDAHARAKARQAAHQLGQALAVMCDLDAITHGARGVDDAHRVRMNGPVQAGEDIGTSTHGQTPQNCGMTARVGRRGGKLINWRSSWVGVALHPVARRGLPAPRGLLVSYGPSEGKQKWQSPQRHGSRFTPSVILLGGVNAAQTKRKLAEHGLPTGCFAVVDNTLHGLMEGQRVVHNQARWTTLHRGDLMPLQYREVA